MRTLALFGTGLWLGLLIASWIFASITFRTAATLAGADARPEMTQRLASLKSDDRLPVLRHMAAEINRTMFRRWLLLQVVLGAAVVFAAARAGALWPAAGAMAIVLIQAALQAPMSEIGRSVDFLPRPLPAEIGSRFGRLHGAYVLIDLAKGGLLAWLGWVLARAAR